MAYTCTVLDAVSSNVIATGGVKALNKEYILIGINDIELVARKIQEFMKVSVKISTDKSQNYSLNGLIFSVNKDSKSLTIGLTTNDVANQRKAARVELNERAIIDIGKGTNVKHQNIVLINMSAGGIAFSCGNKALSVGDTLVYHFKSNVKSFFITAEIIWKKDAGLETKYGAQFKNLAASEITILNGYIANCMENKFKGK